MDFGAAHLCRARPFPVRLVTIPTLVFSKDNHLLPDLHAAISLTFVIQTTGDTLWAFVKC